MFAKFLMKNWHFVAIAILIAGLSLVTKLYLDKRDELAKCEVNLEGKKAEVVSCNALVSEQNDAIKKWKLKGEELEGRVRGLTEKLGDIEIKHSKEIAEIMGAKVPESCEGSMSWMVDEAMKQ